MFGYTVDEPMFGYTIAEPYVWLYRGVDEPYVWLYHMFKRY